VESSEDFEEFVRARTPSLFRFGFALTGSQHDGADLVQEALIRLGAAWPRVRRRHNPEGYVRTTMVRLHISIWRRRRRERLVDAVPDRGYTDAGLLDIDARGDLWQALAALPPRQRAVLVLRYYENWTDDEIASMLGVSRGTVRSQAFRALERLRSGSVSEPGRPGGGPAGPERGRPSRGPTAADPTLLPGGTS
jgi:RNA polymerase sigma-70 factor (sigma-E family)